MALALARPERRYGLDPSTVVRRQPTDIAVGRRSLLEDEPDELAATGDVGPVVELVGVGQRALLAADDGFAPRLENPSSPRSHRQISFALSDDEVARLEAFYAPRPQR